MGIKESWQVSSKGKKAGIIGGSVLGLVVLIGASVGIAFALKPKADKTLDLWLPWTADKQYSKTMATVVNEYNATHDGYDVKITYINGYDAMSNSFEKEVKAGGIRNLPELYLNYGDATAKLATSSKTNYAFNFESNDAVKASLANVNANLLERDNQVNGTGEGTYRIPVAMSSEGMGIDAPLFVYLLHTFVANGGTITLGTGGQTMLSKIFDSVDSVQDGIVKVMDGETETDTQVYNWETSEAVGTLDQTLLDAAYNNIPSEDLNAITGKYIDINRVDGLTIEIDDTTFNTWTLLEALGEKLMQPFIINDATTNQGGINFMGLDSADNEFHQMATMINGGNGLTSIKDGNVNYDLVEKGSDAYNALESIYNDFFLKGAEGHSLWLAYENEGAYMPYGSAKLTTHNLALSVGSTAGLSYYSDTKDKANVNPGQVVYAHSPQKFSSDSEQSTIVQQGPSLGAVNKYNSTKKYDNAIMDNALDFVNWFLSPDSKMTTVEGSTDLTPAMYFSKNSNYITATKEVLGTDSLFGNETALAADADGNYGGSKFGKYSIGPKVAFDQLQQVSNGEAVGMNENISNNSKTLRGVLKQGAINPKKNISTTTSGTNYTFNQFEKDLIDTIDMFDGQYDHSKKVDVIINEKN